MRGWGKLAVLLVGLSVAACSQGVAEFQLYNTAFETQYVEGERVIDRLAQSERQVWRAEFGQGGSGGFDPDAAAYYVDIGDPPLTGAVRASFRAVRDYNAALAGLASGEAAATLTGRVTGILSNFVDARANFVTAAKGPSSLSGAVASMSGATKALDIAIPIFGQLAKQAGRAEFRRQLIRGYPEMKAMLVALRSATPQIYNVMRASYLRDAPATAADIEGLERDKRMLAGWVILIDATLKAMDSAALAAMSGSSAADLSILTDASVELRVLSEQLKAERLKP